MKKLFIGLVLLTALGMVGCQSSDDIFEKNMECVKYTEKIKNVVEQWVGGWEIKEIFYSPKLNECAVLTDSFRSLEMPEGKMLVSNSAIYSLSGILISKDNFLDYCYEGGRGSCDYFIQKTLKEYK